MADYVEREFTLQIAGIECVVREQDANWEQYLYDNVKRYDEVLPNYWAGLTVKLGDKDKVKAEHLLKLRGPDLDQIAVEIFRAGTLDDSLILTGKCPECGKRVNYAKDLWTLDFLPIPDGKKGPDPTFEFVTPRLKNEIVWGYLTGEQEFEEKKTPGFRPGKQVWKAIRSINGNTDIKLNDILSWPIADHEATRAEMWKKRCGYDTRIRLEHSCGNEVVMNLLTDPSFMFPGVPIQMRA